MSAHLYNLMCNNRSENILISSAQNVWELHKMDLGFFYFCSIFSRPYHSVDLILFSVCTKLSALTVSCVILKVSECNLYWNSV